MDRSARFLTGVLLTLMVVLGTGAEDRSAAAVVDPNLPVAGINQRELSQQWWQWAVSIPMSGNPMADPDGSFANVNNNGKVFFVAGNLGNATSTRTFNVPAGKPLFFPMINYMDFETSLYPPTCFDLNPGNAAGALQCALGYISPYLDNATNLHATLDGQDLLTYPDYRQTSTSFFDITLPDDNFFSWAGIPGGFYPGSTVADGYWVALDGLSVGWHTLNFGGTFSDGSYIEITDTINAVPEPGTLCLLLLGTLAALGQRRFFRKVQ